MLTKIMSKLGMYMEQPQPEPTFGKLDEYKPLSKDELQRLTSNRITAVVDRRKK